MQIIAPLVVAALTMFAVVLLRQFGLSGSAYVITVCLLINCVLLYVAIQSGIKLVRPLYLLLSVSVIVMVIYAAIADVEKAANYALVVALFYFSQFLVMLGVVRAVGFITMLVNRILHGIAALN